MTFPCFFKRALCERFPLNCVLKNVHISKEQRRGLEEVQLYSNRWVPLPRVRYLSSTLYMEPGERMICAEAPIETFICSGLVVKILTFLSNCSSCTKAEFLRPLCRQAWFGRLSDETSRLHWYSNRQSVFTVASSKFCTCNTLYLWKLSSASVFSRPTSGSNCGSLNGHRAVLSLIQAAKGFLMLTQEFVSLALNSRNCPV